MLELDKEEDIHCDRKQQEHQADNGEGAEAGTDGAEIFDELLLLEGVAVGGFANTFELIFDALEGGDLFEDLGAQFAMAGGNLGEAALDGFEINFNGRRRVVPLVAGATRALMAVVKLPSSRGSRR